MDGQRLGGPDSGSHRHEIVAHEFPAVAVLQEILANRLPLLFEGQRRQRLAVEAKNVADHAVERRPENVAPLREERVQSRAAVLEVGITGTDAETHDAGLRRLADLVKEIDEIRVGPVVEDDEPGIDRNRCVALGDVDRVGMSADVRRRLVDGNVVLLPEYVGGRVTCDAGADDCDPHASPSPLLRDTLDLGDVVAQGLDHAEQHVVVLVGNVRLACHDPDEVAFLATDNRLRIIVV